MEHDLKFSLWHMILPVIANRHFSGSDFKSTHREGGSASGPLSSRICKIAFLAAEGLELHLTRVISVGSTLESLIPLVTNFSADAQALDLHELESLARTMMQ